MTGRIILVPFSPRVAPGLLSAAAWRAVTAPAARVHAGDAEHPILEYLDDQDVTIGFVRKVVRTPQGKILLLVSQGGWLGWGERLVAAPIEVMAIFGRQLASLDMEPKEYASASTWVESGGTPIPEDEIIRIALARR